MPEDRKHIISPEMSHLTTGLFSNFCSNFLPPTQLLFHAAIRTVTAYLSYIQRPTLLLDTWDFWDQFLFFPGYFLHEP